MVFFEYVNKLAQLFFGFSTRMNRLMFYCSNVFFITLFYWSITLGEVESTKYIYDLSFIGMFLSFISFFRRNDDTSEYDRSDVRDPTTSNSNFVINFSVFFEMGLLFWRFIFPILVANSCYNKPGVPTQDPHYKKTEHICIALLVISLGINIYYILLTKGFI